MTLADKGKTATSETGQIPRHIMEMYQDAADKLRESSEAADSLSITGAFKMRKNTEGSDMAKDSDAPTAGSAAETAKQ
ncbi:MAG: hypothetical protein SF123_21370 [Chloroflexota bacterium]|nr:hypothetical protein [Chloroflexota bacterium]